MLFPALFYVCWDILFTYKNVWSFNEKYITGYKLFNLPIEEVLFFFVVPFCCVFIYECVLCYFPKIKNTRGGSLFFKILGILLLLSSLIFFSRTYTFFTFLFTALFILAYFIFPQFFKKFYLNSFLCAFAIILIPFFIINGVLTSLPVVLYTDSENLGIRIFTIPFEDTFYGMLLILLNITLYERRRS